MSVQNTFHPLAAVAVTAAVNETKWGKDAAIRFALRRGAPMRLVKLAMALERDKDAVLWSNT